MKKSEMVKILTMVSALDGRSSDDMQGNAMWRQMSPDELDESARRAAAEIGWDVPEAVFE
jgi:hypothetical protein